MMPHWYTRLLYIKRVKYLILANGTPQSVPIHHFGEWYPAECTATRPNVQIIFYAPSSALCSVPSCAVIIFNGASSSATVNFLLKGGYTSFWKMIPRRVYLYVILANDNPQHVPRLAPTFTVFFYAPSSALFSVPSCAVIIFNGSPSSASV